MGQGVGAWRLVPGWTLARRAGGSWGEEPTSWVSGTFGQIRRVPDCWLAERGARMVAAQPGLEREERTAREAEAGVVAAAAAAVRKPACASQAGRRACHRGVGGGRPPSFAASLAS